MGWKKAGNAFLEVEKINFWGIIEGNLKTTFSEATIASNAKVNGKIEYKSVNKNTDIEQLAASGNVTYTKDNLKINNDDKNWIAGIITGFVLYKWTVFALFGMLLIFIWRKFFTNVAKTLTKKPWESFLVGLLAYIVPPIATILLLITIVGAPIAGIIALLYIVLLLSSAIVSTAVLSAWFIEKVWGGLEKAARWKVILSVLVISFLFAIITGVDYIAIFFAMGALFIFKTNLCKKVNKLNEKL